MAVDYTDVSEENFLAYSRRHVVIKAQVFLEVVGNCL
jgi:hypothetical protein